MDGHTHAGRTRSNRADHTRTSKDYYLGNGVADGTGEFIVEAVCRGGINVGDGKQRPNVCSRLRLTECFKNVRVYLGPVSLFRVNKKASLMRTRAG